MPFNSISGREAGKASSRAGIKNRSVSEIKEMLSEIIEMELPKVQTYLDEIDDPKTKLELIAKLLPFVVPRIQTQTTRLNEDRVERALFGPLSDQPIYGPQ